MRDSTYRFIDYQNYKAHSFFCMGGLCEVLVETSDSEESKKIFTSVYDEAKRLEIKYSRYRDDNIVYKVNNSNGKKVSIDKETYRLLKFADSMYYASSGMFDITSGVLRRAWTFDGSSNIPPQTEINPLLNYIDWKKVIFDKKSVSIPEGFELDFGGLGKEYAVDKCADKAKMVSSVPTLVNLGGDIAVTSPKKDKTPWSIGFDESLEKLSLFSGAVATSGDKNKYLIHNGKRLSHILNPKTGWPVENSPRAITVVAPNCTEAGAMSTLALLHGAKAKEFLAEEAQEYRVLT